MPIYSSKRFSGLALASLVIGIAIVGLVGWSVKNLFLLPIQPGTAFYQVVESPQTTGKPMPYPWAQLNHTIKILDKNIVESIFTLTAKKTPFTSHIEVKVDFDDPYTYTQYDPAGVVLEGNQTWSGEFGQDLQLNQTITIYTKTRFDFDAKYCVTGWMITGHWNSSCEGYGTKYYITVVLGTILSVTDEYGRTSLTSYSLWLILSLGIIVGLVVLAYWDTKNEQKRTHSTTKIESPRISPKTTISFVETI